MAKVCYGSVNDATAWVDLSESIPADNVSAYTLQVVAEATAQRALLFELFGIIRSELKLDLSLLKLRPLLFQVRTTDTSAMSYAEAQQVSEKFCIGWYTELRVMPITMTFITNVQKCAYSFIHFLTG